MNNIKQKYPTDNWGQSIIDIFLKDGGFQREESKQAAHESFLHLTAKENAPDEVWGQRCNALAIWALICIELDVQELEPLCSPIYLAMEAFPNGEHPCWFGQLAFDLVMHKFSASLNDFDIEITTRNLFKTIKLAAKSSQEKSGNTGHDFFREGRFNSDDFNCLIGVEYQFDVRQLSNTKKLLKQLGNAKVYEAFYLLVILDMEIRDRKHWLQQAEKGAGPISQLAAYFYGCLLAINKDKDDRWKKHLRKVVFPSEDDADYDVLSELAQKAKRKLAQKEGRHGVAVVGRNKEEFYNLWRNEAKAVADQWETAERCVVDVQDLVSHAEWKLEKSEAQDAKNRHQLCEPIDLPVHIRSLTVETGRLVESFLKWCLSVWHIKLSELPTVIPIEEWGSANFDRIIGPILGGNEDSTALKLDMFLHQADLKLDMNATYFKRLDTAPFSVWDSPTNLNTLVVANAIAARCNNNHLFRHTPTDS